MLIVDDHEMVRAGLRTLLQAEPGVQVVGEAATAAAAVLEAQRLQPGVVLMDLRLPDMSGIDACRQICARVPGAKVLFLTSYAAAPDVAGAIAAGAAGYLLKDIQKTTLVQALRRAASGSHGLQLGTLPPAQRSLAAAVRALSPQERRVLGLVGAGLSNGEIAAALGISLNTVKNYLGSSFQKLGVRRRAEAAVLFPNGPPPAQPNG